MRRSGSRVCREPVEEAVITTMWLAKCQSCGRMSGHESEAVAEMLVSIHLAWCKDDDAVVHLYAPGEEVDLT